MEKILAGFVACSIGVSCVVYVLGSFASFIFKSDHAQLQELAQDVAKIKGYLGI